MVVDLSENPSRDADGNAVRRRGGRHGKGGPGGSVTGERGRLDLSWHDLGLLGNSIAIASREWRSAAERVRDEYGVGPQGPWIIGLIASNQVTFPSDLSKILRCARSLISLELSKLNEAGLINYCKSDEDGRQVELSLTPLGEAANLRLAKSLHSMLEERLAGYSRENILYCARLLRQLAGPSIDMSSRELAAEPIVPEQRR